LTKNLYWIIIYKIDFKEYDMWKRTFYKIMIYTIFCLGLNLVGCVSVKDDPNGKTTILEGSWENNNFKLVVKGNYYISLYNNILYGRGQITFDGKHFILASTHAWKDNQWNEFVETINGECVVDGNILTIKNVEGRYNLFNGEWRKIKDIDIEEYINNPPASVRAANVI
jgi:hypothetical protein